MPSPRLAIRAFRVFLPPVDKRATPSRDFVVQGLDWLLGVIQTALNVPLYSWSYRLAQWRNGGRPWPYFNYVYVTAWAAGIAILALRAPVLWIVALVALWRASEVLTWYIKLLFDKGHRVFLEVERNLLFLVGDGAALVTLLALILRAATDDPLGSTWPQAFEAFTLNGAPEEGGRWATLVGILGTVGGLALLAAGLGIVIGIIGGHIEKALEQDADYTGPTRPPLPRQQNRV